MSSQIVGPQMDTNDLPCLVHNSSPCRLGDGKDPLIGSNSFVDYILLEMSGHLLGNKYELPLLATFGTLEGLLPVLNISKGQLEDLTDPHPAPGHEFENQSVSGFDGAEYELIHYLLFENGPSGESGGSIELFQHGSITGASEIGVKILGDEVEE